jgi:hypothetical protein
MSCPGSRPCQPGRLARCRRLLSARSPSGPGRWSRGTPRPAAGGRPPPAARQRPRATPRRRPPTLRPRACRPGASTGRRTGVVAAVLSLRVGRCAAMRGFGIAGRRLSGGWAGGRAGGARGVHDGTAQERGRVCMGRWRPVRRDLWGRGSPRLAPRPDETSYHSFLGRAPASASLWILETTCQHHFWALVYARSARAPQPCGHQCCWGPCCLALVVM